MMGATVPASVLVSTGVVMTSGVVVTSVSGVGTGATAVVVVSVIGSGAGAGVYVVASFRIGIRWSDSTLLVGTLLELPRLFDLLTRLRFRDEPVRCERRVRQGAAMVLPEAMLVP